MRSSHAHRQRYWARSYVGYPPVQVAEPNKTHYALAALHHMGFVKQTITQVWICISTASRSLPKPKNVDRLQHKAMSGESNVSTSILEIHGSLKHVHCVCMPSSCLVIIELTVRQHVKPSTVEMRYKANWAILIRSGKLMQKNWIVKVLSLVQIPMEMWIYKIAPIVRSTILIVTSVAESWSRRWSSVCCLHRFPLHCWAESVFSWREYQSGSQREIDANGWWQHKPASARHFIGNVQCVSSCEASPRPEEAARYDQHWFVARGRSNTRRASLDVRDFTSAHADSTDPRKWTGEARWDLEHLAKQWSHESHQWR